MKQQWQERGEIGYGYDSRYLNVIAVIDDAVMDAEHGRLQSAENRLQQLLDNIMEHARAENLAMLGTYYPDRAGHELDHVMICKTIAGLCWRWSRTPEKLNDLYDLRSLVFRHIGTHDHAFGEFLMGMGSAQPRTALRSAGRVERSIVGGREPDHPGGYLEGRRAPP